MKRILTFIILLFLFSCNDAEKTTTANIKKSESDIIDLADMSKSTRESVTLTNIDYIFLELNDQSAMGPISKSLFRNGRYYFLDRSEIQALYVFSDKGKFLYKLSNPGKGPGETINVLDFEVDSKDNVYLWDGDALKIVKYSENGKVFSEIKQYKKFFEFTMLNDNAFAFGKWYREGALTNNIAIYNIEKNALTSKMLDSRPVEDDVSMVQYTQQRFYKSGNKVFYYHRFTPFVYSINSDGLNQEIEFKNASFANKEFLKRATTSASLFHDDMKNISDISHIYQDDSLMTFRINRGLDPIYGFFNRKNSEVIYSPFFMTDIGRVLDIMGVANGKFFSTLDATQISLNKAKIANNKTISSTVKAKFMAVKEDDNPIIVLFNIKTK